MAIMIHVSKIRKITQYISTHPPSLLNLKAQLAYHICASSQQQSTNTDLNSIPSSSRVPELAVLIAVRISLSGTTD